MDKTENKDIVSNEVTDSGEENDLVIKLKTPIVFEGERYEKIDLSGLENVKASDMVAINRRLSRNGNVNVNQELTLEYALHMASYASNLPVEFFDQLPPYAALAVKSRVTNFLYGWE